MAQAASKHALRRARQELMLSGCGLGGLQGPGDSLWDPGPGFFPKAGQRACPTWGARARQLGTGLRRLGVGWLQQPGTGQRWKPAFTSVLLKLPRARASPGNLLTGSCWSCRAGRAALKPSQVAPRLLVHAPHLEYWRSGLGFGFRFRIYLLTSCVTLSTFPKLSE